MWEPPWTNATGTFFPFLADSADATATVPLNYFHDGPAMQSLLESYLERKTGARYGPPGTKRLVCFVDGTNLPAKDKYDTQTALELLRQGIDSKGWYDKQKALAKEVSGMQFVAALNPTVGSFTLSPRLQRHFTTLFVPPPTPGGIVAMLAAPLVAHLSGSGWGDELRRLGPKLVAATVDLHVAVLNTFLPR